MSKYLKIVTAFILSILSITTFAKTHGAFDEASSLVKRAVVEVEMIEKLEHPPKACLLLLTKSKAHSYTAIVNLGKSNPLEGLTEILFAENELTKLKGAGIECSMSALKAQRAIQYLNMSEQIIEQNM